jgi:O-antigen ligase
MISIFYFKIIDLTQFEVFHRLHHLKYFREYERYADYEKVWKIFEENWYFFGEGSWGYRFLTGRDYPHNIILECISDYGLIGFISILSIITYGVYHSLKILKNNDDVIGKIIVATWLVLLSSVLVSGNINSNAIFFIYTSVLISFYRTNYIVIRTSVTKRKKISI